MFKFVTVALLLLLSACSPSNTTPLPKLFNEQRDALDQAKTIEAAQQQQAEKQHKAIDQQTE